VRLLAAPAGGHDFAASRVRVYQHLPALAARGVRATIVPPAAAAAPGTPTGPGPGARLRIRGRQVRQALALARRAPDHDVTLVQRLLLPAPLRRLLARRARALVFDVDDAIYTDPGDGVRGSRWLAPRAARWAGMLGAARAATVATDYLAGRARRHQPHTVVVASPVDTERYRPAGGARGPDVVIGWIGSPATSPYVEPLLPVLQRLAARHPALRVELVGADPRLAGPGVRVREWRWDTEVRRLQAFDVGIMPLPDDEWARAKAGYKLLQYMACGVAAVASPVGAGPLLVHPGETGWLAADEGAWEAALTELIENPEGRRRMGRAARELAEAEHSLRRWTPRLHGVLEAAAGRPGREG
jgi:glycosyltransferase involved in cell wall biosynthesis